MLNTGERVEPGTQTRHVLNDSASVWAEDDVRRMVEQADFADVTSQYVPWGQDTAVNARQAVVGSAAPVGSSVGSGRNGLAVAGAIGVVGAVSGQGVEVVWGPALARAVAPAPGLRAVTLVAHPGTPGCRDCANGGPMNLLRAVRASAATLAVLLLCSCAQPGSAPPVSQSSSSVSRIRVVNDSAEAVRDLHLLFPEDEVAVGDVAAGSASGYVEVPHGVYNYSAFRFLRGGESVVQPVIDFVGETPLPIDDYTYVLGVDRDRGDLLEIHTVLRDRRGP